MKKIAVTIAAMTLSTAAFADISMGNSDLEGWAVEDESLRNAQQRQTADIKSPYGNPDQYGGVLFTEAPESSRDSSAAPGVGDSYGSILHSVGFDY